MSIICSKYQSTRDFSFKDNCFVQEASTLSHGIGAHDGRVYDDACDVGFIMVSHVTGDAILFVLDSQDLNGDEIAGWRYKATYFAGPSGKWLKLPETLAAINCLIIND